MAGRRPRSKCNRNNVNHLPALQIMNSCISNSTILIHFDGISGEFGRAMVCILIGNDEKQLNQNTHSARSNQTDMFLKCTRGFNETFF